MGIALLGCPFCGKAPWVFPIDPKAEGDAWTQIRCFNGRCPVQPSVTRYSEKAHFRNAAKAWNTRRYVGNPT